MDASPRDAEAGQQPAPAAPVQPADVQVAVPPVVAGGHAPDKDVELGDMGNGQTNGKGVAPPSPTLMAAVSKGSQDLKSHTSHVSTRTDVEDTEGVSVREFWYSLPDVAKVLLIVSVIETLLLLIWAPYTNAKHNTGPSQLHITVALMVTALFFLYFVIDALAQENGLELLAALVLSVLVEARLLWFTVANQHNDDQSQGTKIALATVTCSLQFATVVLAWFSWRQFGWRMHGRLAADYRKKDASSRVRLYFANNALRALLKLDFQFLVILGVVGILYACVKRGEGYPGEPLVAAMLAVNIAGVLIASLVSLFVWLATKDSKSVFRKHLYKDMLVLDLLVPPTLWWPIANLALLWMYDDRANARVSLAIASVTFIFLRLAVLGALHVVDHYDKEIDRRLDGTKSTDDLVGLHPDLLPLVRGAWLGKPSMRSPHKKRYFQVSHDGRTLRWSWKRFIRLFYTEAVHCDHTELTITISTTADPDLTLKFSSRARYDAWCAGFEQLLGALLVPTAPGAAGGMRQASTRRRLLERMGFVVDPTSRHFDIGRPGSAPGTPVVSQRSNSTGREQADDPTMRAKRADLAQLLRDFGAQFRVLAPRSAPPGAARSRRAPTLSEGQALSTRGSTSRDDINALFQRLQLPQTRLDTQSGLSGIAEMVAQRDAAAAAGPPRSSPAPSVGSVLPSSIEVYEYSELAMGQFLGAGAEGEVREAWLGENQVAVKKFFDVRSSIREVQMHMSVGLHSNIVQLRGLCHHEGAMFMILEYCPKGNLHALLKAVDKKGWDLGKLLPIVLSIAEGMEYLHSHEPPILHRDLKPGNIFVGFDQVMKIGDFGMARFVEPEDADGKRLVRSLTVNAKGTVQYAAPELYNDEALEGLPEDHRRLLKIDVFAFGVSLWECMERRVPHEDKIVQRMQFLLGFNPEAMRLARPKAPGDLPRGAAAAWAALSDLVDECTAVKPDARPTFATVVQRLSTALEALAADPAMALASRGVASLGTASRGVGSLGTGSAQRQPLAARNPAAAANAANIAAAV